MAFEISPNLKAGATVNRYCFLQISAANAAILATENTPVIGASTTATRAIDESTIHATVGEDVSMQDSFMVQVIAFEAITAGNFVKPANDGSGHAAVAGAGENFAGQAVTTAAADQLVWVSLLVKNSGGVVALHSDVLDHADFTDGGGASGTIDVGFDIPAGSLVLGYRAILSEVFAGDVSAAMEFGDGSDPDSYNSTSDPDVFTATGTFYQTPPALVMESTAVTVPTLTITVDADWGSVTGGKVQVTLYFLPLTV